MEAKAKTAEANIDRSLTKDDALENASHAAELYMKATKLASSDVERKRLRDKCIELLSRAEEIKKASEWSPVQPKQTILKAPRSQRQISKREEIILLEGSKLHGFVFPPWTAEPDDAVFDLMINGSEFYSDAVELELSDAQREIFAGWKRPDEAQIEPLNEDLLMAPIDGFDLVQDITTDCSVVASLCAGTARASKGHGTLLTSIVYPRNKGKTGPRVSKNGKYIFRLHFNGCFRRVTIDDRLPTSTNSRSLHVIDRHNPQLLWPALVEKAYLKVRGGYDFPGSNSGTDLWVLSGWIPEQVFLRSDEVQPNHLWNRIFNAFGYGDVMITLGTGRLSRKEEKALGLAGEHDYAVLDMRQFGTQRLLLIKNPWCDGMVWKKSLYIPEPDDENEAWAKELRAALPDDTAPSQGTFWMTFEDVIQHYESLYLNWNPGLFLHRQDHHLSWTIPTIKNPGSFTHNPQYSLQSSKKDTVWILLSRHFQTGEQEIIKHKISTTSHVASSVLGFISIYIFSSSSGRRVYLSDDALHRGAYVDSPQTLARLEVLPREAYTVVVAQHGLPLPKYSFTISFFSRQNLTVETASDSLPHWSTHNGSWTSRTAGGNASAATYPLNPQYSIKVPSTTPLTLVLEADQEELAVHVKMVWAGGARVSAVTSRDIVGGSGDYRRGCAFACLPSVAAGTYTIVCSTFEAGQTGRFTLRVGSAVACAVQPVLAETAGRLSLPLPPLVFTDGVDRMLAPIHVSRLTRLRLVARARTSPLASAARSRPLLKMSLERGQGPNKTVLQVTGEGEEGEFSDAPMGIRTTDLDLGPEVERQGGLWVVVERLGGRSGDGGVDEVDVEVLSDNRVRVDGWGVGDG